MTTPSLIRSADALLRSLGGASIALRLPQALTSGATATEIGLAAPATQDVTLAPVAVRALSNPHPEKARARFELLISATAVNTQLATLNFASADALFSAATGFIYNGSLLRIESLTSDQFAGAAYLYRVIAVS